MLLKGPGDSSVRHQVPDESHVELTDCKSDNAACKSNRIDLPTPAVLIRAVVCCLQIVVVSGYMKDDAQRLRRELQDTFPGASHATLALEFDSSHAILLLVVKEDHSQFYFVAVDRPDEVHFWIS